MPSIRIHGSNEVFTTGMLTSLLNVLLSNNYPIETICGGRAQCGKCVIRVHSGAQFLSPIREKEALRLASLGAGPDMRLACQSFTRGDVVIEPINIRKAGEERKNPV
jgi:adenylate cyclase